MFGCDNGYLFVGCHSHASPLNLEGAIMNSCNSYFCQTYRRILENQKYGSVSEAYEKWKGYLNEFGFGVNLGTDFVNELPGFIPAPVIMTDIMERTGGKRLLLSQWQSVRERSEQHLYRWQI